MADWVPIFVVGVDFGMTCTGVAYSYAPEWPTPKPLQYWPGLARPDLANKVPSQLIYHPNSGVVKSWGFQCNVERDDPAIDIKEDFKLNLDPHFKDVRPDAPSCEDAMRWFQDYILVIYRYTISHLAEGFPRFNSRRVEFIFSVPTTWKDPRMVARLKDYITLSSPMHRATIGLTEAEAAAVYASGHNYQRDDVILVCDAGGGTMDVNILKFLSAPGEPTKFAPLGLVEGEASGSVMIDIGAHEILCNKLNKVQHLLPRPSREVAREMMQNHGFEQFKCSFGSTGTVEAGPLELSIPGLGEEANFPEAKIVKGCLQITQEELRELFDLRAKEMHCLLDDQIDRLHRTHPLEKISFIVLSGGFGGSPYMRRKLKDRYEDRRIMSNPIEVLTVDEPQLAVVQGLVLNRKQQLQQGSHTIHSLFSRVSYGVICDQLYDPSRHTGETVRHDKWDKKIYATQQIDWIVKQGQLVPRAGVTQVFRRKILPNTLNKPWMAQIVMSTLPLHQLPQSMSRPGARLICNIRVDMSSVDRKPKNDHWYDFRPKYYVAHINLKVVVGPTDLGFELWNMNGGRIRGETHDPVTVSWNTAQEKMDDQKDKLTETVLHEMGVND
ncbi:hypothetical protein N7495_008653 [Penicillium taxi]|uniref:uncharacterized protein n=1 Tax=Penicillium taxi TaxID=168475 RepID=UPI0025451D56|nr:uncharacterized protein N7495_008653 [Penicillium taxi]KAJ5888612.1 hypothetical protein N7495_008653 [Penicillium taxi]